MSEQKSATLPIDDTYEGDLFIGLDVGSTTVKTVVVRPDTKEILWSDYQRHHTKQPEKCLELLTEIGKGVS